ncbi:16S rRNA (guanine(966)-N(2))-methyltransferase RsmD [Thiomicrorhabdus sp. zzn3]|nr:16S rRNA (guanine(966)-N(2))-methyltransferase RsmD [Thiomicrorhabdus sp. zzn3]MDG6777097.1 16S rRNA (guanine(966)-N(2))-methyltransferase RsmD [Thiomicrorhabdus sp. zzn3]
MGEVRIIGGDWRGRKLPVLNAEGLRPTSDRVRETVFNWLQFEIPGGVFLDAFAGSGALGMEALSRGAAGVTFLELAAENQRQLQANLTQLQTQKADVIHADTLNWLDQPATRTFDGVFLDPPFHQDLMQKTVDLLLANGWLKNEQAWLYIEQEKTLDWPVLPQGWQCTRDKTTAQVRYGLFRFEGE